MTMPKMALRNIFRRRVSSLSQYKNEGVVLEKKSLIIATLGLLLMACSLLNLRHGFSDVIRSAGTCEWNFGDQSIDFF